MANRTTHLPVLLDVTGNYNQKCSRAADDYSFVTNEMLEILHLEDGSEFDGNGRTAIAGYVADPFGDNDTNRDETPFTKFRAWVLHLCFLVLYHYLCVGDQTLVVAKTDIIAICDHLGNDILPKGQGFTLDRTNRIRIASRIYGLVRRLLKIRPADLEITTLIGNTSGSLKARYKENAEFSKLKADSWELGLRGFARYLIDRVLYFSPGIGGELTVHHNVWHFMLDNVCIRLGRSLSAHNASEWFLDNHLFTDDVCADIFLHIRLLVAKKMHMKTITFDAMHGETTVAVPRNKPNLPSRGRKRSRKKISTFPAIV
jgi:hypothetical protein